MMNCTRCNAPLEPEARFCRNCGLAVASMASQPASASTGHANQPDVGDSPAVQTPPWQAQQSAPFQPKYPSSQSMPPQAYQPTVAISPGPGSLPSTGRQSYAPPLPTRRRKNRLMQVLLIVAISLFVIMLVAFAGWLLALRPILSGLAQNQIDSDLSSAVNQITPAQLLLIPPGRATVPLTQEEMNNFLASNTTPSDPVQQNMTITPTELRLDFQTYGITSTITGVPQVVHGQIVITHVTVQGIASLLLSPDDLTTRINAHLRDAGLRIHRVATGVELKNGEMDIQLD